MDSLHGRLLIAATLVLAGFLGAAGVALHSAFRDSAEEALRERLLGHVYAILAAANEDTKGRMLLPSALPDQRFSNPSSGLYAIVVENNGPFRWYTPSLAGQPKDFLQIEDPGKRSWRSWQYGDRELLALNFGVAWEDYQGQETRYTLAVAADLAPLLSEISSFRIALWTWLGGLAGILLIAQGVILHWGLSPLRRVVIDLHNIENGDTEKLAGNYPKELQGLTNNLNALISNSRTKQQRYRNSLDDLAHSLKTPLTILRNATQEPGEINAFKHLVQEQTHRMDSIVQHQLRRAVAVGHGHLGRAVPVTPLIERLTRSLSKVYQDKSIQVTVNIAADARFFGDEADLLEVLGNLTDNAFKYGQHLVRISAYTNPELQNARSGLIIGVEDDGPGIDPALLDELTKRGTRLDESIPGEGIGLAVANEIITLYKGHLEVKRSPLGGTHLLVYWPSF